MELTGNKALIADGNSGTGLATAPFHCRRLPARKRSTQNRKGVTHMFDMRNLTRLKKLDENAPDTMKAFWAFNEETFKAGAIDVLHKQLMAVAVALTTQCPYCIELHMKAARKAGANDTMLTEAAIVSAVMRANATVTHATHLFKE